MTAEQDAALAQLNAVSIDPHKVADTPPKSATFKESVGQPIDPHVVAKTPASTAPYNALPARIDRNAPDQHVKTVGQEQLERSEKMIRDFGTPTRYMEALDTRDPDERPRAVPGVGFRSVPDAPISPSLYPDDWVTMSDAEKASWEASHHIIDPHKVAETPPNG
jgi:hypothetical protein